MAGVMVSCQIVWGAMLPNRVFGSMLQVRPWQDKTTVAPQPSREHASADDRGSMAPQIASVQSHATGLLSCKDMHRGARLKTCNGPFDPSPASAARKKGARAAQ